MAKVMYFKHSEAGTLAKIEGGIAGKAYIWDRKEKRWIENENTMRILDPNNDRSFWYDDISAEEAQAIMAE